MFQNQSSSLLSLRLFMCAFLIGGVSLFGAPTQTQYFDGLKDSKIEWLHTLHFYNNSKDVEELNLVKVKEYHERIEKILDAGKVPIGALNSWIFPEFVNAPRVSGSEIHMGIPVTLPYAIPPFNDPEYERLVNVRFNIFKNLAKEFNEIDTWLIGYEGNYVFKDLNGNDLDLDSYAIFVVDTLESSCLSIKEVNPNASVISHFLGRWGFPIKISGQIIQPSEIISAIKKEIKGRGDNTSIYFDQLITDLVPSLAGDRLEVGLPPFCGQCNYAATAALLK
jgi:hypothetical protein